MNTTVSPLDLTVRVVNSLELKSIELKEVATKSKTKRVTPRCELDYDLLKHQDDPNSVLLKLYVQINTGKGKVTGYSIKLRANYYFQLHGDHDEKKRGAYFTFTAISIAIADLRGYLTTITASLHRGEYKLPLLDVRKLIQLRQERISSLQDA